MHKKYYYKNCAKLSNSGMFIRNVVKRVQMTFRELKSSNTSWESRLVGEGSF